MATSIETLRAIHHPVRRRIVEFLFLHGPSRVGTLARELDQQVGSISHHLRMLQRAGVVEPAPELSTDGRTSWWRVLDASYSWAVEDFETPAQRLEAKAAQRTNLDHQLRKLAEWRRAWDAAPESWRKAAFATDFAAMATADELEDLGRRLLATLQEWRSGIDAADGAAREPVFVFAHGFRSRP